MSGLGRPRRSTVGRRRPALQAAPGLVALVVAAGVVLALSWARPVSAHAVLVSTTPTAGALLDEAPARVVVTFNEPVEIEPDSLVVIDSSGAVVSSEPVADGSTVVVEVATEVPGWHAASWRVLSADGHPLSGAWTFRVGGGSAAAPSDLQQRAAAAAADDPLTRNTWIGGQFVSSLAATVVVGSLFLAVAGIRRDRSGRAGFVAWSALAGALASALAAAANGPYSVGGSMGGDLFSGPASGAYVARAVAMVAVAAGTVLWGTGSRARAAGLWAVAVLGLVAVAAFSGHAPAEGAAARVAVAAHLVVAACWLGAIPALVLALRGAKRSAGATLATFSVHAGRLLAATLVLGSLAALVLSGGPSHVEPRWGRILVGKLVLVAVAVVAGAANRRVVSRDGSGRDGGPDEDGDGGSDGRPLPDETHPGAFTTSAATCGSSVVGASVEDRAPGAVGVVTTHSRAGWSPAPLLLEALALVGIVALSVAMTHNGPPREMERGPAVVDVRVLDDLRAQLVVDPAEAGPNWVHLYLLDAAGLPQAVESVEVTFASSELGIEPIPQALSDAGNGHHLAITNDLGLAGTWEVAIRVRVDRFQDATAAATIVVEP